MERKHNEYRRKHKAGHINLNNDLNTLAQLYADKLASTKIMKHSTATESEGNGENIYHLCGTLVTGADVTEGWYQQIADYNWDQPGTSKNSRSISFFTQV